MLFLFFSINIKVTLNDNGTVTLHSGEQGNKEARNFFDITNFNKQTKQTQETQRHMKTIRLDTEAGKHRA